MALSRADLEYMGITYDKIPAEKDDLPRHVDNLRSALVDFACTIPSRLGLRSDQDIRDADKKCGKNGLEDWRNEIKDSVVEYESIRTKAARLCNGGEREAGWQTFYYINFFLPLADGVTVKEKDRDSRQ